MKTTGDFERKQKISEEENFKIAPFKKKIKKTKPHKHGDYYELIYIESGEGFHWIETERYPIRPPELYFLQPGQLHCWQFTEISEGYVALFKTGYFDALGDGRLIELLEMIDGKHRISLKNEAFVRAIFKDLYLTYQSKSEFARDKIIGDLRVLFAKVLSHQNQEMTDGSKVDSLFVQFQKMLIHHCPQIHTVKEYAQLLHTSPQNLNAVCRKNSTFTANEMIIDQMILESKRYLLYTDRNIGEISESMCFNDASYFVKFFKKHVGTTPHKYRLESFH